MIGYLMNNVLPRAGEVVRPYSLGKIESIPMGAVFGTVVVERMMDMMSFLILLLILPILYNGPLRESFPWLEQTGIVTATVIIGLLAVTTLLVLRRDFADLLLGKILRLLPARVAGTLQRILHSFLDGFLFVKRPRNFAAILVLSFLIWFLYVLMMYVAFHAFSLQETIGLRAAVVVLTIATIGVALPTPGSTGTYHFFVSASLTKLFSIPDELALSYATVTHAIVFIGTTVVGLYFLLHDHIRISDAVVRPIEQPQ
jgi:uncharacterized protein (TIRG00374 family)